VNHTWLGIEQKRTSNPSGSAMGQREPLTDGDFFQPADECFLRPHFDVSGNRRLERHLHQVESKKVPHHRNGNVARCLGMGNQRQLYLATLCQAAVLAEPIEGFGRQIAPLQQRQGKIFSERGIRSGSYQRVRGRIVIDFLQSGSRGVLIFVDKLGRNCIVRKHR
jgi:hypothetical protein